MKRYKEGKRVWKRLIACVIIAMLLSQSVFSVMGANQSTSDKTVAERTLSEETVSKEEGSSGQSPESTAVEASKEVTPEASKEETTPEVTQEEVAPEASEEAAEKETTKEKLLSEASVAGTLDQAEEGDAVKAAGETKGLTKAFTVYDTSLNEYLTSFRFWEPGAGDFSSTHPVTEDSYVNIRYEFLFPNSMDIGAGSIFSLQIPREMDFSGHDFLTPKPLQGIDYDIEYWVENNVLFMKTLEDIYSSNVEGYFQLSLKIDHEVISEEDIHFDLGDVIGDKDYPTEYEPERHKKISVEKESGKPDFENKTLEWCITVTPEEGDSLAGYTLQDIFDDSQILNYKEVYMDDKSNPIAVTPTLDNHYYPPAVSGFTYQFPTDITAGEHKIYVVTDLTDILADFADSNTVSQAVTLKNGVKILWNEKSVAGAEDEAEFVLEPSQIDKITTLADWENGVFTYDITINQEGLPRDNVEILDILPNKTTYQSIKVVEGSTDITSACEVSQDGNNLRVKIEKITDQVTATVTIKLPDNIYELDKIIDGGKETGVRVLNKAKVSYDGASYGEDQVQDDYQYNPKGNSYVSKTGKILEQVSDTQIRCEWNWYFFFSGTDPVYFRDVIESPRQTYVPGSFKINGVPVDDALIWNEDEKSITYILEDMSLVSRGNGITYETLLNLDQAGDEPYTNEVFMKQGDKENTSEGSVTVAESDASVSKSGSYDSAAEEFEWKVTINRGNVNAPMFANMVVKDVLPEGHEYVEDSVQAYDDGISGDPEVGVTVSKDAQGNVLFHVEKCERTVILTFKTKMKDGLEAATATNHVYVSGDFQDEMHASTTVDINYTPAVNKKTNYDYGKVITWQVDINNRTFGKTYLRPGAVLEDTIHPLLDLDITSVKLYRGTTPIEGGKAVYTESNRLFSYTLPEDIDPSGIYRLVFDTNAERAYGKDIVNNITLKMTDYEVSDSSDPVYVRYGTMGGGIEADNLNIQLTKTGAKDMPLGGATFELFQKDENGNDQVLQTYTTVEDGVIRFTYNFRFKRTYYLRETNVVDGYKDATGDIYKIDIADGKSTDEKVGFTLTKNPGTPEAVVKTGEGTLDEFDILLIPVDIENELEDILIRKTDITGNKEVAGATITIYEKNADDSKGREVATWSSGDTAHVLNPESLGIGKTFIMEETAAPGGYSYAANIEFSITADGMVEVADKYLDDEGNIIMKDEVTRAIFKKTDVAGKEVNGATLTIYERNEDGSKGTKIEQWISGEDGDVHVVEGVLNSGQEYILEETSAPEGYEYAADIVFKVEKDGTITVDDKYFDDGNIVMVDKLKPTITTVDLFFSKEVTGTAGDKTKDFTFTITLKDLNGQELTDSFVYLKNQVNSGTLKSGDSVTLKDGDVVVIKELPVGTSYAIVESDNAGYEVTPTGDTGITIAGTNSKATFKNHKDKEPDEEDPKDEDIVIRKTDITGSKEVAGATLTIYRRNSDGSKGDVIDSWTSGEKGHEIAMDQFTTGESYILEETSAPDGYAYATDIEFTIQSDGTVQVAEEYLDEDGNIIMKDEAIAVNFKKTDVAGKEVAGATLTIYEKNADGSKGNVVTTWISDNDVHTVGGLLNAGQDYILEETAAPGGYEYAADIHFTIERDGTVSVEAEYLDEDGNVVMVDELTPITTTTVDLLLGKTVTGTAGDKAKEFTFTVTLKDLNGQELSNSFTYLKNQVNGGTLKSGDSVTLKHGDVVVIKDLPVGTSYEVTERDNADYVVTAQGDKGITVAGTDSQVTFVNHKDENEDKSIVIRKTDIAGSEEVAGATLTIYHKNSDGSKGDIIATWTSGDEGHEIAMNLFTTGESYILEETSAPGGYSYAADIEFSIESDGSVKAAAKDLDVDGNIIMKDEATKATFKKTDVAGEEVEGATLTIYEKNEDGSRGKEITQWVSGENGESVHVVEGMLNAGQTYILHETGAPEGYAYADDIEFTLTADGTVQAAAKDLDADGNIVMKDEAEGSVQISKVEVAGDGTLIPLEGATLSIYTTDASGKKTGTIAKDNDGKELTWTTTNHPINITNLKPGTYVLHEEKAPEGYLVAADIYFTIKQDGSIVKISKTGKLDGKTLVMEDIREGDVDPGAFGLSISKTVTGTEGDKDKVFTFTVTFTDENGEELDDVFIYTYGDDTESGERGTFRSGDSFYLTHGEHVQLFGMPMGTNYEVIESDNEGYEVIEDNTSGTIGDAGDAQEASFINHKGEDETPTPTETPTETPTVTPTPTATEAPTATPTPTGKGDNNYIRKAVRAQTYRSVKTGDSTQLMLWVVGMIGAAGAISIALYKKKRKEQIEQ